MKTSYKKRRFKTPKKGIGGYFSTLNPNAGNVEYNNSVFNMGTGLGMTESIDELTKLRKRLDEENRYLDYLLSIKDWRGSNFDSRADLEETIQDQFDLIKEIREKIEGLKESMRLKKYDRTVTEAIDLMPIEDTAQIEMHPDYGYAVRSSRELDKEANRRLAKHRKELGVDELDNTEEARLYKNHKVRRVPELKKMHLSESLFEECEDLENKFTIYAKRTMGSSIGTGIYTYALIVPAKDKEEAREKFNIYTKDEPVEIIGINPTTPDEIRKGIIEVKDNISEGLETQPTGVTDKKLRESYEDDEEEDILNEAPAAHGRPKLVTGKEELLYKQKRDPLGWIIYDELLSGEQGYRRVTTESGKVVVNPTSLPSANYDVLDVAIFPGEFLDEPEEFTYIRVNSNNLKPAIAIADKYHKSYSIGKNGLRGLFIKTLSDEDWEKPYEDKSVPTYSIKGKDKVKTKTDEEDFDEELELSKFYRVTVVTDKEKNIFSSFMIKASSEKEAEEKASKQSKNEIIGIRELSDAEVEENKKRGMSIVEALENESEDIPETQKELDKKFNSFSIAEMLNNLIISEFNAINDYNRAISSLMGMGISPSVEKEDTTQIINILQDILNEENIHVGQLQTALQKVAPSADEIEKGTTEAKEQIEDATTISQEVEDSEATETTTMKNEEESLPSEEEE